MDKLPRFETEHLLAEKLKDPQALIAYDKFFLGNQIKKFRLRVKMKQSELAHKLGTTQSSVARMEAGKQNFTVELLVRIGLVLGRKLNIKFQ